MKGWLKFSALPLNTDSKDKYKKLIISGKLGEEWVESYQHVKSLPAMVPTGITCGIRVFADVQKLLADNEESMFSGSLSQLSVDDRALATIDFGRIGHVIESAGTDFKLKEMLGDITINIEEGGQKPFMRANKDAEVDALCLLIFWHAQDKQVHSRLIELASDLVFLGRRLGLGSKVFAAKFDMMNLDETSRDAMPISSWRQCIFLSEYLACIILEEKHAEMRRPTERLMKVMTEDCDIKMVQGWSADTLGRFLAVGRCLESEQVKSWLIVAEATFKRNAFLDKITLLRGCCTATRTYEELARLLQILFLEQLSGLKKRLKVPKNLSPVYVFKA